MSATPVLFRRYRGECVAVMGSGFTFRDTAKATEFRAWLYKLGATVEGLPDGSFKGAFRSTGVAAHLVVIDKPAEISGG